VVRKLILYCGSDLILRNSVCRWDDWRRLLRPMMAFILSNDSGNDQGETDADQECSLAGGIWSLVRWEVEFV